MRRGTAGLLILLSLTQALAITRAQDVTPCAASPWLNETAPPTPSPDCVTPASPSPAPCAPSPWLLETAPPDNATCAGSGNSTGECPVIPSPWPYETAPPTPPPGCEGAAPNDSTTFNATNLGETLQEEQSAPQQPAKDPTIPGFTLIHPPDERDAFPINVTSNDEIIKAGAKGNGSPDDPFTFDHLAIANKDGPAIRIENIKGYVKLDNMSLAGHKAILASNISSLEIVDVDGTAAVHGIETNNIRLLNITRTNITALAFGMWIKKGQAIFYQDRVIDARDAMVLESVKGDFEQLKLAARHDGLVARDVKGTVRGIAVTQCSNRSIGFRGGVIDLIGAAVGCGEVGIQAEYVRGFNARYVLMRGVGEGILVNECGDTGIRSVQLEGMGGRGIAVKLTPVDISHAVVTGGNTSVEIDDTDDSITGSNFTGASVQGILLKGASGVLSLIHIKDAPTGIMVDHSGVSIALDGVWIEGANIALDTYVASIEGVGITRVALPTGDKIGARLRRSYDGSSPFDWAGLDAVGVSIALSLEDHSDISLMGLTVRDSGQVARINGSSVLRMNAALKYVRGAQEPWEWLNVGRLIEVKDRSFVALNATKILTGLHLPIFEVSDNSALDVDGSQIEYREPAAGGGAQLIIGQGPGPPPPEPPVVSDRTMFHIEESSIRINASRLANADTFLHVGGMRTPGKGELPPANYIVMSSLMDAKNATVDMHDSALDWIGSVARSQESGYEYGIHAIGDSVVRVEAKHFPNETSPPQLAELKGATIADLAWDAPAKLPLTSMTPPVGWGDPPPKNGTKKAAPPPGATVVSDAPPSIRETHLGHVRLSNIPSEWQFYIYNVSIDRLQLDDVDVFIQHSSIGPAFANVFEGYESFNDDRGIYSNRTKPETLFQVNDSRVTRIVLEHHTNATVISHDLIAGISIRNSTGPGPLVIHDRFNSTRPYIEILNGPAQVFHNDIGNPLNYTGIPMDRAADRGSVVVRVEHAGNVVMSNDSIPWHGDVFWNDTSGTFARSTIGGVFKVVGVGTSTVNIIDDLVYGRVDWRDSKGLIGYDRLEQVENEWPAIFVHQAVGHAPATPEIISDQIVLNDSDGIWLASGGAATNEVGASPAYTIGGRIFNNVFSGIGRTAIYEDHGQYVGNDGETVVRRHDDPRGANVVGNTFQGGVYVPCHYFDTYTTDDNGNKIAHSHLDSDYPCTPDQTAKYAMHMTTHNFGGAASGTVGIRPAVPPEQVGPKDPLQDDSITTRSRNDTPQPTVSVTRKVGEVDVPCRGYELQRLAMAVRARSFQQLRVAGAVYAVEVGPWEGIRCDERSDIQITFLDGKRQVNEGDARAEIIQFDYKPNSSSLTMMAEIDSQGPAGHQSIELLRDLSGVQTAIGFIPVGEGAVLDTDQATKALDDLKSALTPEEFTALVAAVVAAFAAAGINYVYVPPDDRNKPPPGAPGKGPGPGPHPMEKYMDRARDLTGNDPQGNPVGLATKATLLAMQATLIDSYQKFKDHMEALQGKSPEEIARMLSTLSALVSNAMLESGEVSSGFLWSKNMPAWKSELLAKYPDLGMRIGDSNLIDMLAVGKVTGDALVSQFQQGVNDAIVHADKELARIGDMKTVDDLWELGGPKYGKIQALAGSGDPRAASAIDAMRGTWQGAAATKAADDAMRDFAIGMGLGLVSLGAGAALAFGDAAIVGGGRLALQGISQASTVYDAINAVNHVNQLDHSVDNFLNAQNDVPVLGTGQRDLAMQEVGHAVDKVWGDVEGQLKGLAISHAASFAGTIGEVVGANKALENAASWAWGKVAGTPPKVPTISAPSFHEPSIREPSVSEPSVREPSFREPTVREPTVREPGIREPSMSEPGVREPSLREPSVREPSIREPSLQEPSVREPTVGEPAVREPAAREPVVREPAVREPSVREPVIREPAVREPSAREPTIREPTVRERAPKEDHPALDRSEDHLPDDWEAPDPAIAARKAGVSEADLARVDAAASAKTNNAADAANIRSTAVDRLRLAKEGYDPFALHTEQGKAEFGKVSEAVVHAHQGGLTQKDVGFLKDKLAQDPHYLDGLGKRGKVLEDGDFMPMAEKDSVNAIRDDLRAKGIETPPPTDVRVKPTEIPIESTMPTVREGKYIAPEAVRVEDNMPTIAGGIRPEPSLHEDLTATQRIPPPEPHARSPRETPTVDPEDLTATQRIPPPEPHARSPRETPTVDPEDLVATRKLSPHEDLGFRSGQTERIPAERTPIIKNEGPAVKPHEPGGIGPQRGVDIDQPSRPLVDNEARLRDMNSAIEREAANARAERVAREEAAREPAPPPQDVGERRAAIQASGMVPEHAEAASRVAQKTGEVSMWQGTNQHAGPIIKEGGETKDLHMKPKSADEGNARGYLPVDQSLSKAAKPNEGALRELGWRDGMDKAPFVKKSIDTANAKVQHSFEEPAFEVELPNGEKVMTRYVPLTVTGAEGKPVLVVGRETTFADGTKRTGPITADYDPLALATKNPQMLQTPASKHWDDPNMGALTANERKTVKDVNVEAGRDKNPVVHHGFAVNAPIDPGIGFPVTAFEPDGSVRSIKDLAALKDYINGLEAKGYHMDINQKWKYDPETNPNGWRRDATTHKWI